MVLKMWNDRPKMHTEYNVTSMRFRNQFHLSSRVIRSLCQKCILDHNMYTCTLFAQAI